MQNKKPTNIRDGHLVGLACPLMRATVLKNDKCAGVHIHIKNKYMNKTIVLSIIWLADSSLRIMFILDAFAAHHLHPTLAFCSTEQNSALSKVKQIQ